MAEWREVLGFNILYEVSDDGRVRTRYDKQRGYTNEYRELTPLDNGHGYLRFNWRRDKKQQTVYLHRLVAEAFIPNPNGYSDVNHKDENKRNNTVDNLEWCDHEYNSNYGTRNERGAAYRRRRVRCVSDGKVYASISAAAHINGVTLTALSNHLNGRSKSCCGKVWAYVDA